VTIQILHDGMAAITTAAVWSVLVGASDGGRYPELTVIGFDWGVRELLDVVPRRWDQLGQRGRVSLGSVHRDVIGSTRRSTSSFSRSRQDRPQ
jgi:hypothetical protein